nr:Gag-Pol polyprotein [Tanacetum cinerariifolium]
ELENKVAKLLKENKTLKKNYKELFNSIKITRAKTTEHTTSLIVTNDKFKAQLQEKGFTIAALKNELRKSTGNSVNTKFAKSSILRKPMSLPHRNQSVDRQLTAFKSERPRISKPRCSNPQDTQPIKNIQPTSAPFTPTYVHAEKNTDNQAEEEYLQDDKFTNPFYHPLEQVRGNPSRPVQTRRQLATDSEMCMYALTVSTAEPKNIKEAMADSAWIEAMQEELHCTQVFSNLSDGRENGISKWSTEGGGSNLQDKQPSMNIPSTSKPSTPINVPAKENTNDQAEEEQQLQDDKFTNPFCAPPQDVVESSSHNIGNSNVPTFNQP